ncbi:50S ribosomal protein L11 methyltransferase [Desulfosoma caldarium]|uniref:Ribosomal protein L11 methyltransferase PrmA n=1 Tax=Desulfosoma caldarium TaxID=610254 RepID=A0A3N1VL13_9BACT|nr:50S ribosomal protein L11 methyltransferase [Desulfosoma caldarium]ROR01631.1 ribosomal protein L11 methyltransferase PrmA [Desulfosoma caldarium]
MKLDVQNLPSVYVSPFLPWEPKRAWLRVRTQHAFHPFHVTTRLCLEIFWIWRGRLFFDEARVLDVGCGTGILALVAAKLGARWCVGVDVAREAIGRSRENSEANGLQERVNWVHGSIEAIGGTFHTVVANVPWACWEALFDNIVDCVAEGGALVASGFQDLQAPLLESFLHQQGFLVLERRQGDLTFFGVPPSGSFTWCALLAARGTMDGASPTSAIGNSQNRGRREEFA